jgi:hypothetical protein
VVQDEGDYTDAISECQSRNPRGKQNPVRTQPFAKLAFMSMYHIVCQDGALAQLVGQFVPEKGPQHQVDFAVKRSYIHPRPGD